MNKKHFFLFLLFFESLISIFCKIADPNPVLYNKIIFNSHLNIVYAFDVSKLSKREINSILNGELFLVDVDETEYDDDYLIKLKPIWKTKVYAYIPPIISLDQFVNYIDIIEIDNNTLRVENSSRNVFFLNPNNGTVIRRNYTLKNIIIKVAVCMLLLFSVVMFLLKLIKRINDK